MKPINLLPKSTCWKRQQWLYPILLSLSCFSIFLYYILFYPKLSTADARKATAISSTFYFAEDSIDTLQLTGYLIYASDKTAINQHCSLIKSKDGRTEMVKVGDYLGQENAKVVDIDSEGVELSLPNSSTPFRLTINTHGDS